MPSPEIMPEAPQLSLSAEAGRLAESAVGSIEGLAPAALGIGIGILFFKRGIEAILFQKNPFRPLMKDT